MQVQQGQRKNPPVGQNLGQWNGEGWGQGISTGMGWSDSDTASHQSDGQEIGMWVNSQNRGFTSAASSGNKDSKSCDSHDKDPWTTDTDNVSAMPGSVISSSNNPGQGQGSVAVSRGPNTSGASSMWGSSFAATSDSRSAWDAHPGGGASGVWGSTPAGGSEHDLFMQGDRPHSGGGGDTIMPPYTSGGDTKSLGWANISQNSILSQQQQQPPRSSANASDTSTASVTQTLGDGAQQQAVGSGAWQGMDMKTSTAALGESGWGGVSAGNNAMSSSLGMPESSPGMPMPNKGQPMLQRSGSMDQWDRGSNGAGSWGEPEHKQSDKSGWGSPVSNPLPNAGTEGWSRPDVKSEGWGQAPGGQAPGNQPSGGQPSGGQPSGGQPSGGQPSGGQPSGGPPTSGWTSQPDTKSNSSGWGNVERPAAPGWGESDPAKSNPSGWGQSEVEMGRQPWDDKPPPPPMQQMPWESSSGSTGNNPSSEWGSGQPTTSMSTPGAGWNSSNPMATAGSNRPVGSQPPPPPPMQQQQQPPPQSGAPGSTWAQAAVRGLVHTSDTTRPPPVVAPPANMPNTSAPAPPGDGGGNTGSRISKEDLIAQVVNSSEGWGKVPIRQDTAWNVDNSKQHIPPHKPVAPGGGMGPDEDANHWHQPNNGTAIWEATKDGSGMPPPPPQPRWNSGHAGGGPSSSDADAGTWNGPPSQQQGNMYPPSKPCPANWQAPPSGGNNWNSGGGGGAVNTAPPTHNWSGSGASSSSGSWEGGNAKMDWEGKKDDSVFNNRDGTHMWGEHGGAPKQGDVGSWGGHQQQSASGRSSTTGDGESGDGWGNTGPEPPCPSDGDDGTTFWGENPHQRSQSWNGPDGPPGSRPISGKGDDKGPPMWNQPPPQHPLHRPFSYGDCGTADGRPMPNQMNDAFWGPGGAQPKPGNWGDPSWMNVPKPNKGPGSWGDGGPDPNHWNMKRFPLPMNANFGSVSRQQQPQMRSRLIQQLMDMGFKKEDAQNALIRNNMNLESAIADLVASAAASRRPDLDFCDMPKIRQVRGMGSDSMGDGHMDNSGGHVMPPNTPFSNAQTQFMNSQAFVNSHKQQQQGPASLQAPSSLLGANSSINSQAVAMQQKLLQQQLAKKHQQPPPMPAQGQPIRGGGGGGSGGGGQLASTTVQQLQQQQAQQQQQIVQQLHMAVTAGLISPQLLNQQMTPTMLVMLQQLLQLQQMLQQLVSRQQLLMQQPSKSGSRQQLDATIQEIQQQILRQQQQIAAAQQQQQCLQQNVKQPPPPMPPTHGGGDHLSKDLIKDLSALDMGGGINLKDLSAPGQQQVRSRLTQWKLPSPEKDAMLPPGGDVVLNKVVGGKPLQQSHSTPNLQTTNNLPFFDSTWSSNLSSASMWPTAMQSMTANSPSQAGELLIDSTAASSTASKESLVASVVAATTAGDVTSSTTSGTASPSSESGSPGESLDIVEFFPGKKWQGVEVKSIEDDPHMTPGSVSRSLSIATIKEDYLMSMFGKTNPDSSSTSSSAWSAFSMPPNNSCSKPSSAAWQPSPTDPTAGPLTSSDPWQQSQQQQAPTVPKNTRPPPGLAPTASKTGSSSTWQNQFSRSQSWTPGERSLTTMGSSASVGGSAGWGSPQSPTNWLVLKNLTPQIDGSTLKTLCMQHGPLQMFYLNQGMALVRYNTRQEAVKAQNALDSCILSNTTILAECIGETEVMQLLEQTPAGNRASVSSSSSSSLWPQQAGGASHPPTNTFRQLSMPGGTATSKPDSGQWNGTTNLSSSVWSGDGLWAPTEDDHTC